VPVETVDLPSVAEIRNGAQYFSTTAQLEAANNTSRNQSPGGRTGGGAVGGPAVGHAQVAGNVFAQRNRYHTPDFYSLYDREGLMERLASQGSPSKVQKKMNPYAKFLVTNAPSLVPVSAQVQAELTENGILSPRGPSGKLEYNVTNLNETSSTLRKAGQQMLFRDTLGTPQETRGAAVGSLKGMKTMQTPAGNQNLVTIKRGFP